MSIWSTPRNLLREIQLNHSLRDRCSAHISGDGFNAIPMAPVYFLFSMDLETGVMIPGH